MHAKTKIKLKRPKIPFASPQTMVLAKMIDPNRRVYIYKNCRDKCLSVRQGKRVVAHTGEINVSDAVFFANNKSRKCGYGISGYIDNQSDLFISVGYQVVYDPRVHNSFVNRETFEVVKKSSNAKISIDSGILIPSV